LYVRPRSLHVERADRRDDPMALVASAPLARRLTERPQGQEVQGLALSLGQPRQRLVGDSMVCRNAFGVSSIGALRHGRP
jgi:hypothetical protein